MLRSHRFYHRIKICGTKMRANGNEIDSSAHCAGIDCYLSGCLRVCLRMCRYDLLIDIKMHRIRIQSPVRCCIENQSFKYDSLSYFKMIQFIQHEPSSQHKTVVFINNAIEA